MKHALAIVLCATLPCLPGTAEDSDMTSQCTYKTIGDRTLVADIDYPEGWAASDTRPAIVFFSGGAWRNGTTRQFTDQAKAYTAEGMVAVRAEYRDSTRDKVNVDTCAEDAISAVRWVRKNAKRLGIDPQRIVAAGGSAGGFLAASTWTTEGLHAETDDTNVSAKPDAFVLFNPVFDLLALGDIRGFDLEGLGAKAKQISPAWNLKKDMPPMVILIGTEDGFLDQVKAFVDKSAALGNTVTMKLYDGQQHAFFNHAPWKEKTVAESIVFLKEVGILR